MPADQFFDTDILVYPSASNDPSKCPSRVADCRGRLTSAIHPKGVVLARERGLSVYDALTVAAAQDAGCRFLFSEEKPHDQKFGALTVENPFRSEADAQ